LHALSIEDDLRAAWFVVEGRQPTLPGHPLRTVEVQHPSALRHRWRTIRINCRGRLQDLNTARNHDGGPGQLHPLVSRCLYGTATRSSAVGLGPESHSGPVAKRMADPDAVPATRLPWPGRPVARTRTTHPRQSAIVDRATRRKPRGRMSGATRC